MLISSQYFWKIRNILHVYGDYDKKNKPIADFLLSSNCFLGHKNAAYGWDL